MQIELTRTSAELTVNSLALLSKLVEVNQSTLTLHKEFRMHKLFSEELRRLTDLKIPGRPHISTIHRWRLRGVRGHRLETVKIGGHNYSSDEAVKRFLRNINSSTAPSGRQISLPASAALLDAEGI